MHSDHCLVDVDRWVQDGSWDPSSVIPDPAIDWIDGPYASEYAAEVALEAWAAAVDEEESTRTTA